MMKENQEDKAEHFRENIDYVKEQAAKKVAELCQRELDLRQPVRYIVFYNELLITMIK